MPSADTVSRHDRSEGSGARLSALWPRFTPGPQPVSPYRRRSALARACRADPDRGAPLSLAALECPRRIFTEHLPAIAAGPWSRRTGRLGEIQRHLGLALGGQAGARLAERLAMPASGDTLLRLVRRIEPEEPAVVRAVGIDDWAWRKGHRYGTIVVDLERHKVVDLLPDREADTVAQWLTEHPEIEVVSRDRSAAYADAARRGAPQALQAADRWHLLENLGQAVRTALDRHGPTLRDVAQGVHSPITGEQEASDTAPPMTSAERRQYEGWERRRSAWIEAVRLQGEGLSIKAIARELGLVLQPVPLERDEW